MAQPTAATVGGLSKILYQGQLANAQATLYTAPAQPPNCRVEITAIWICNTDSSPRACTLRVGTGSLTAANSLLAAASIQGNQSEIIFDTTPLTLSAGMVITGFSDQADKITVTILGKVWAS